MESVWGEASAKWRRTNAYGDLRSQLEQGELARVRGCPLAVAAWMVELLSADLDRPALIVVPRQSHAVSWVEAGRLFASETREVDEELVYFPTPALTPYQEVKAPLLVRAGEALALHRMLLAQRPRVVTTMRALFQLLPLPGPFLDQVLELRAGQSFAIERVVAHLEETGYRRADLVAEVGLYAVRGGVVDLYPPGEPMPIRLDYFGDELEAIRLFDPVTQRSEDPLSGVSLRPLSLFPCGDEDATRLADELEQIFEDEAIELSDDAQRRLDGLRAFDTFPGWENYLPLAHQHTSLSALLHDNLGLSDDEEIDEEGEPLVVLFEGETVLDEAHEHRELLAGEFETRLSQRRLVVAPEYLSADPGDVEEYLSASCSLRCQDRFDSSRGGQVVDLGASRTDSLLRQLPRFPREVETARARGEQVLIVAPEENHQKLKEYLETGDRETRRTLSAVKVVAGDIARGFRLPDVGLTIFGEEQLFARRVRKERRSTRMGPFFSGLRDLKAGEYIVHEDHGIGQFLGIRTLDHSAAMQALPSTLEDLEEERPAVTEVMEIVYGGERTLLLPLERIHQIQRYSGLGDMAPRLDRLGGSSWAKKKARVKRGLKALATDLLKLYAQRQMAEAPSMGRDSDLQLQFEAAFEFQETDDQLESTRAIKKDLESTRPMDRLLCGDVGFGKTEVAMRAAFKAVDSGYQVAVLAPTTILADQHLETFKRRFAGFPVRIEMISRFRTAAQVKEIRERLAAGQIDILIGTHRLLSKDIEMPKLALLVIDEEQRFGVAQKERMKEMRKNVHVLTMSATPVPRTLQLSLAGVRDMSLIEEPPKDRMAVETRILPFSADLIREAIQFELDREGQVYFVYNRVEGIEEMSAFLRELIPGLRITIGHGQMNEKELSERMHAFTRREFDVLLATTIIENGIDIPNVNTMIVHRSDRFGMAQLYQLRGRVGRSDQLAFCYLLTPSDRVLSEDANERLAALREFTQLGAGFRIAARDLEIRGAGNLLGAEQSGHIAELGIETYMKMLEDTIRELRGETREEAPSASLDLGVPVSIPAEYIGDANLRMDTYQRLTREYEDVASVLEELRDRFGPPPESVANLIKMASLKRFAESLRVQSIIKRKQALEIRLRQDARVDIDLLVQMVQESAKVSFSPSGVLRIDGVGASVALGVARSVLERIAPPRVPSEVSGTSRVPMIDPPSGQLPS